METDSIILLSLSHVASNRGSRRRKDPQAENNRVVVSASQELVYRYVATNIVLSILFIFIVYTRVFHTRSVPYYNPAHADCFYWTEAAFHLRHFQMVSDGRPIPKLDRSIQYPEGLDTRRCITPIMKNVYGRIHRWSSHDVTLHRFLIIATSIFTTCSVLACFWVGREIHGSLWVRLIAAACYGLSVATVSRGTATLLRENVTSPLLFCSFTCFVSCIRKDRCDLSLKLVPLQ